MNRKTALIASIALIVIGLIGRIYADQYSYVSADGMLHDSIWLPIGTLMVVAGVLALLIVGLLYLVSALRNS